MRLVLNSNAPWAGTGYGGQAALLGKALRDAGHDVAFSAFWGLQGGMIEWEGFPVYPGGFGQWGDDILDQHARHWGADTIWTLQDLWPLQPSLGARGFPWIALFPVDHQPLAPVMAERLASTVAVGATFSRWSVNVCREAGFDVAYLPHGYDPAVYHAEDRDMAAAKAALGFEDRHFVVGMVAANKGYPSRKSFDEAFAAFALLAAEDRDARLYVHTFEGSVMAGPDLGMMARAYGIADRVRFPAPYHLLNAVNGHALRRIYQAFDVLLAPSMGEGFGVPVLEAQACGTPVIVTDFSAQTELCGAGWRVAPARLQWIPLDTMMAQASVPGLVEALRQARDLRREAWADRAIAFAARYRADRLARDYWAPFAAQVAARLYGPAAGAVVAPVADMPVREAQQQQQQEGPGC